MLMKSGEYTGRPMEIEILENGLFDNGGRLQERYG